MKKFGDNIALITLGCPKNEVDSDLMATRLVENGYKLVSLGKADLVIINTCGFITSAKEESIRLILEILDLKKETDFKDIIVTGCLAQRYPHELTRKIPEINGWIGLGQESEIVEIINEVKKGKRVVRVDSSMASDNNHYLRKVFSTFPYAYVKIADGCDNFCSYCTLPYIKGRFRSRSISDILKEIDYLVSHGIKEIILIAQDVSSYGRDLEGEQSLGGLLQELSMIRSIRIRLLYLQPKNIDDNLISIIASANNIYNYFDLPLQHVSRRILKRMNRWGGKEEFLTLIKKIRDKIPEAVLRTSFIVGFPGEEEDDFLQLLSFIEEARFNWVGAFKYSDEEETKAYSLMPKVSERNKKMRLKELMGKQQEITFEENQKLVGKKLEMLPEKNLDSGQYKSSGRSYREAPEIDGIIFLEKELSEPGQFIEVKIKSSLGYDLTGEKINRIWGEINEYS